MFDSRYLAFSALVLLVGIVEDVGVIDDILNMILMLGDKRIYRCTGKRASTTNRLQVQEFVNAWARSLRIECLY